MILRVFHKSNRVVSNDELVLMLYLKRRKVCVDPELERTQEASQLRSVAETLPAYKLYLSSPHHTVASAGLYTKTA